MEDRLFWGVGVRWVMPVAVLRATWQRGHPATSPWKRAIIGYASVGRTELSPSHIKKKKSLDNDKIELGLEIQHSYFEEGYFLF